MKTKNEIFKIIATGFFVLSSLFINNEAPKYNARIIADETAESVQTAFEVYSKLQEGATSFNAYAVNVDGNKLPGMNAGVTFGAEKEASSWLLSMAMGPKAREFKVIIKWLDDNKRETYLRDFFTNWTKNSNGYRTTRLEDGTVFDFATDVVDIDSEPKTINLEKFAGVNFAEADLSQLDTLFDEWLEMTEDRPFSFLRPSYRKQIFNRTAPGLEDLDKFNEFVEWQPNFGLAERYLENAHETGVGGWEINFKPQNTYAEFEEMILWFRKTLKNSGKLFQAPGHQRIVFAKHPDLPEQKLAELYKNIQALIIIEGIAGKTNIEFSNYKDVQNDGMLRRLRTERGVIRLEGSRFSREEDADFKSMAVEFRAGTKDIRLSRFYQTVFSSRVATNDFSGLTDIDDWTLYESKLYSSDHNTWGGDIDPEKLVERFGITRTKATKAARIAENYSSAQFMIPLWGWDDPNIPFLTKEKQILLKGLTKDFLEQVAKIDETGGEEQAKLSLQSLMRSWVKTSQLSADIRSYIVPKRDFSMTRDLLEFKLPEGRNYVRNIQNVNDIDLGIEYSGRFPLKINAQYSEEVINMGDMRNSWLNTGSDLTVEEKEAYIKKIATDLGTELGAEQVAEKVEGVSGHGHGLDISYSIRDSKDRKWEVQWDGIGRSYTENGEVIPESVRAGSIELVTPKFTPDSEEIKAVFRAFDTNGVLPHLGSGGGHINIDLAPFEGNPKALARFMSIFHEHRGIISLMFQKLNRVKNAEPLIISDELRHALKNFTGTEKELKKLLYNERYFNTRYGRKSRYIQLEMSSYFQDVIPARYITEDFDIASPVVEWRRQFRVDPKIRKMEFRLFNAPRTPTESALQIRLVKAMLSKALNENGALSGAVQEVNHEYYTRSQDLTYRNLKKMCNDLGLDINDYRPALAEGMSNVDLALRSKFYQPLGEILEANPHQIGWGNAINPRRTAISSEGRTWSPGAAHELNTVDHESWVETARQGEIERARFSTQRLRLPTIQRACDLNPWL
jgi:hypothetical protein